MTDIYMVASEAFSILTICLSLVLKLPQIWKLIGAQQATGHSVKGLMLELSSYTVTLMYNYMNGHSLLTYMEYPIIVLQECILLALVLHYKQFKFSVFLSILILYFLVSLSFAFNILNKFILTLLVPFTTPVSALSKVMQLTEIISRQNADSVSTATWFLSFFTNATRIYTVFMDSRDINLLLNFTISSVLSAAVMFTAIYYHHFPARPKVQ